MLEILGLVLDLVQIVLSTVLIVLLCKKLKEDDE